MKSIVSPIALFASFGMFALSFFMAARVPLVTDKTGFMMLMSFSAMLFILLIMLQEKSRFFIWIEGLGALLWIGIAIFFGLHYFQVL